MFETFTKHFSLSKTLRFELRPVFGGAEMKEDFESEFLRKTVERDERRAKEYKELKRVIDDYFRDYIDATLAIPNHPNGFMEADALKQAYECYRLFRSAKGNAYSKAKKEWNNIQKELRESVASLFKKSDYEVKGSFFKNVLMPHVEGDPKKTELIKSFDKFTTYFTGFNENRKNIFSKDDKATTIGYRLIHENLPKFFDNCILYERIRNKFDDLVLSSEDELTQALGVTGLDEIFRPEVFAHVLTQPHITAYNELLGGYVDDQKVKHQGLNEQINLYRQQKKLSNRQLPIFAPLFKQILAESQSQSFAPEPFENDKEMLTAINVFLYSVDKHIEQLEASVKELHADEIEHIYFKAQSLTQLSQELFGRYDVIQSALQGYTDHHRDLFRTKAQREKFLDKTDFYSLYDLERAILEYVESLDADHPDRNAISNDTPVQSHLKNKFKKLKQKIEEEKKTITPLLSKEKLSKDRKLPKGENAPGGEGYRQVQQIKELLESYKTLAQTLRDLYPAKGRKRVEVGSPNMAFYNAFEEPFVEYDNECMALYNKARNYLSKKPYKRDKIKLNFEAPTLLNGWDLNKERANRSVLLLKNGNYYLAIMHPNHTDIFKKYMEMDNSDNYEKINYKLISDANRMLPRVFFSKKGIKTYDPPKSILELYKKGEHIKGPSFKLESLHRLIDYFKSVVSKYKADPGDQYGWEVFDFKFSPTSQYEDIGQFYKELEKQAYRVWFTPISSTYIEEAAKHGKLFLFQIYNKDFSPYAKGRPNLHTLYWKSLFEKENLQDVITKLNGEAEIFFRHHSIKKADTVIHKAGETIKNKNENNPKQESTFKHDIIKDRRYTVDKILFHVPITINFKNDKPGNFNDTVNRLLAKHPDTHIIGIDRGERHLLYLTVIDSDGNIVEQRSLNTIPTDRDYEVDYRQKLDAKEKERDKARKEWSTIENIKELKSGYLSQVVHELAKLIIQHNAIVVLEDLNFGFKRGRFRVEKQVYQKFEKALIDKLNYLVFKDRQAKEPGGYLNGYQLTAPFESFQKLGKQSGILFYVPAAYTSKIDPATGFIDFLKPKYESVEKAKAFFANFDAIRYNKEEEYFEFVFDYKNFESKNALSGYKTDWTVCTYGKRLRNKRNDQGYWESVSVDVTDDLKRLFERYGILYHNGDNLISQILEYDEKQLFELLIFAMRTTLAMRYSRTGEEEDYILSPVKDCNGDFFDSRKADPSLPQDADANGAYHIALKGAMLLERMREHDFNGKSKLDLLIKNEQWFEYISERLWGE